MTALAARTFDSGARDPLGHHAGDRREPASTLASVALFQPLRRRIQGAVDRLFYRARYDADRTLDAYSVRLRDEVDLRALEAGLIDVVDAAMRPARISLWIRDRAAEDQPVSS